MNVLGRNLEERQRLALPADVPPALLIVVDTEEEFDWEADFSREATQVTAMRAVGRLQDVFEEFGHRPTYVIDYPVATDEFSIERLSGYRRDGRAQIGAHLHPWVSPPYEESISRANSYQGNLDPALEHKKLTVLTDTIEKNFGFRPTIHKAGRYGFGYHSAESLLSLGYEIDLSAASGFDFSGDEGPDYARVDAHLYNYGDGGRLFGIPTTGGYMGSLSSLGPRIFANDALENRFGRLRAGVLSKARLLERVLLSPEGHSVDKMKRLTRTLVARGVKVLTLSMHSPTAKAGCTPYTSNEDEVTAFLEQCRQYLRFFSDEMGGVGTTPHDVLSSAQTNGTKLNS
jgi:hypothetical protein